MMTMMTTNGTGSLGARFIASEQYEESRRRLSIPNVIVTSKDGARHTLDSGAPVEWTIPLEGKALRDLRLATKTLLTSADYTAVPTREERPHPSAQSEWHLSSLIPVRPARGPVKWLLETTFTNAAGPIAEGATKATTEAAFAVTEQTATPRKVTATLPVTDEVYDDAEQLGSYLDDRLSEMLLLKEDQQLISGSGVAPNLTGILTTAGIGTQARGADTHLVALRKAAALVASGGQARPEALVMHPTDWAKLDTTDIDLSMRTVLGLPAVVTTAITAGTALIGAFRSHARIWRNKAITIKVARQHDNWLVLNKLLMVCELRESFAVLRPAAFVQVTGL